MVDGAIGNLIASAINLSNPFVATWVAYSTYSYFIARVRISVVCRWVEAECLVFA